MENSFIKKIEISRGQVLSSGIIKKTNTISPNLLTQIQFLMSRTDELRTVLKEIDETLKRINEESQKSFIQTNNYL
jgi:hypothetical protein